MNMKNDTLKDSSHKTLCRWGWLSAGNLNGKHKDRSLNPILGGVFQGILFILIILLMSCNKDYEKIKNSEPVKKATELTKTIHREGNEPPANVKKELLAELNKWKKKNAKGIK